MMNKTLVFLPCSIYQRGEGYLYGVVKKPNKDVGSSAPTCFYVLGIEPPLQGRQITLHQEEYRQIGFYQSSLGSKFEKRSGNLMETWIQVRLEDDKIKVSNIYDEGVSKDPNSSLIIIIYDDKVLKNSELMPKIHLSSSIEQDHFKILAGLLQRRTAGQLSFLCSLFVKVIGVFLCIANASLSFVSKLWPILRYTALGSYLHSFLETWVWALKRMQEEKKVSLKVGNYLMATAVDICGGILLLHLLDYLGIIDPLTDELLRIAKDVVRSLQYLIQWLSGSPAGLKLNGPFNTMMARFFVYHINLWWIFLSVSRPVLELAFQVFLGIGRLGLTFQAAILADLLALVSFHIYCIHVYAARLYYLQLSGLLALWRLFLGRKRNPLRKRVDSCQYSADQLFVGTLAFTILLFLLPTTLLYYIVFTTMRLLLLGLSGMLTQACYLVRALPIYASLHWLCGSNTVCSSMNVTVKRGSSSGPLVLFVFPIADSWWQTVQNCVPDTVVRPPTVRCGQLIQKLIYGELVYPV